MNFIIHYTETLQGFVLKRWHYCIVVLAVFYVCFRAFFFNFTYCDDTALILDNHAFLRNPANAGQAFVRELFLEYERASYYRPLVTLSLMCDAMVGGSAPFTYHLTNVFLHCIASCLVFLFLSVLGVRRPPAFALTLLFVVHPAFANYAAWLPGRVESLLGIFAFSAMIMLVRFRQCGKVRYLLCHSLFFCCGLFSKESMIVFPLLGGIWLAMAALSVPKARRLVRPLPVAAAWLVPALLWLALKKTAAGNTPVHTAAAGALGNLWFHLQQLVIDTGRIILPVDAPLLPFRHFAPVVYCAAAAVLALFLFYSGPLHANRTETEIDGKESGPGLPQRRFFLFGLSWFLLFLVPLLFGPGRNSAADFLGQPLYVPAAGLLLMFSETEWLKKLRFDGRAGWLAAGCCVFIFALITESTFGAFNNGLSFWKYAIKRSPRSSVAHKNLGAMYYLDGKTDRAEQEYRAALELFPSEPMVHNNLGLIYKTSGEYAKAEEEFKKELAINPNYDNAIFNWGTLCYVAGRKKEAETLWKKTLALNPNNTDALQNLSVYYRETGDAAAAGIYSRELEKRKALR